MQQLLAHAPRVPPAQPLRKQARPLRAGLFQSAHQMQELHVAFVLVEDVVDDLLFGIAGQVVVLAAFTQVHFSAVVTAITQLLFLPNPPRAKDGVK